MLPGWGLPLPAGLLESAPPHPAPTRPRPHRPREMDASFLAKGKPSSPSATACPSERPRCGCREGAGPHLHLAPGETKRGGRDVLKVTHSHGQLQPEGSGPDARAEMTNGARASVVSRTPAAGVAAGHGHSTAALLAWARPPRGSPPGICHLPWLLATPRTRGSQEPGRRALTRAAHAATRPPAG